MKIIGGLEKGRLLICCLGSSQVVLAVFKTQVSYRRHHNLETGHICIHTHTFYYHNDKRKTKTQKDKNIKRISLINLLRKQNLEIYLDVNVFLQLSSCSSEYKRIIWTVWVTVVMIPIFFLLRLITCWRFIVLDTLASSSGSSFNIYSLGMWKMELYGILRLAFPYHLSQCRTLHWNPHYLKPTLFY